MLSSMASLFYNFLNPPEWNLEPDETISVAPKVNVFSYRGRRTTHVSIQIIFVGFVLYSC